MATSINYAITKHKTARFEENLNNKYENVPNEFGVIYESSPRRIYEKKLHEHECN